MTRAPSDAGMDHIPEAGKMVERGAKALVEATSGPWSLLSSEGQAAARLEFQAAHKACREPTRAMIDAGVAFALNVGLSANYTWSQYVADLYRHMHDAALRDGEG